MLTLRDHKVVDIFSNLKRASPVEAVFVEILSARTSWLTLASPKSQVWCLGKFVRFFVLRGSFSNSSAFVCSSVTWLLTVIRHLQLSSFIIGTSIGTRSPGRSVISFLLLRESQHFDEITSRPIDRGVISQDNSSLVKTGI
jgi:hypothetical protein